MSSEEPIYLPNPNAPDNGPRTNAVVWSLFGFASVFLGLRVYVKIGRRRGMWWDDWALLASWVAFLVACIQLSVNIHFGFGSPWFTIPPDDRYAVGMGGLIVGMFIMIAPALSKTSFILTLCRIASPKLKIVLWVIMASLNAFQLAAIIVQWAQCSPIQKVWEPFLPEGQCWSPKVNLGVSMGSAAYAGVMDLVLAAIPWVILKDLQMKKKEKIGIAAAMSLGVVASATAFLKTAYLKILASADFTLEGPDLVIFASTEVAATIAAACIPVLRTLIQEFSSRAGASGQAYPTGSGAYGRSTSGRMASAHRTAPKCGLSHFDNTIKEESQENLDTAGSDGDSDKSILSGRGIMKTNEVVVDYELADMKNKSHRTSDF